MSWLLDTHTFVWMAGDPTKFSSSFLRQLKVSPPELCLSAASAWELAIKVSTGKLTLPEPVGDFLAKRTGEGEIEPVLITFEDAVYAASLPPIHRDPFDRMITAQALLRGCIVVSADPVFPKYGCRALDPTK